MNEIWGQTRCEEAHKIHWKVNENETGVDALPAVPVMPHSLPVLLRSVRKRGGTRTGGRTDQPGHLPAEARSPSRRMNGRRDLKPQLPRSRIDPAQPIHLLPSHQVNPIAIGGHHPVTHHRSRHLLPINNPVAPTPLLQPTSSSASASKGKPSHFDRLPNPGSTRRLHSSERARS